MRVAFEMISAGRGLGPGSGAMIVFYEGALAALAKRSEIDKVVAFTQPWSGRLGRPGPSETESRPMPWIAAESHRSGGL